MGRLGVLLQLKMAKAAKTKEVEDFENIFFYFFFFPLSSLRPEPRLAETMKEEDTQLPHIWSGGPTKHLSMKYLFPSVENSIASLVC